MVTVIIDPEIKSGELKSTIASLARSVLEILELPPRGSLTVRVSTNDVLQKFNQEYLGIDAPTDVLSFPADFDDPESEGHYYGDILVSYEKAAAQAESGGHPVIDEVKLLIVHGILHLLGYDHSAEKEKQEMWSVQNKILTELSIQARPAE
jgi:probable rRNA maturation factor